MLHARRRISAELFETRFQQHRCHVVQQCRELRPIVSPGGFA
jgi:hypothetical protein